MPDQLRAALDCSDSERSARQRLLRRLRHLLHHQQSAQFGLGVQVHGRLRGLRLQGLHKRHTRSHLPGQRALSHPEQSGVSHTHCGGRVPRMVHRGSHLLLQHVLFNGELFFSFYLDSKGCSIYIEPKIVLLISFLFLDRFAWNLVRIIIEVSFITQWKKIWEKCHFGNVPGRSVTWSRFSNLADL